MFADMFEVCLQVNIFTIYPFFLELVQNKQKVVAGRDTKLANINETYQEEQGYEVGIGSYCLCKR